MSRQHMTPTYDQIARLPKWARDHIAALERDKHSAERSLSEFVDDQTPSGFYYEDSLFTENRRYIQTHSVTVEDSGLQAHVLLPKGLQGRRGIEITWHSDTGVSGLIEPRASNSISIMPFDRRQP